MLGGFCVQTVLQSDKDMGALLGTNQNFERWIKHGFSTEDLVNSSNDSEEVLSQGGLSLPTGALCLLLQCAFFAPHAPLLCSCCTTAHS